MAAYLIYLCKVSFLLTVFITIYKLFLAKETFFTTNRIFFILGVFISFVFPFIHISTNKTEPTTTTITTPITTFVQNTQTSTHAIIEQSTTNHIDTWQLLGYVYIAGVLITSFLFIVKIAALLYTIYKKKKRKLNSITMVETNAETSPFSFFNYLVYNPSEINKENKSYILRHEFTHIRQLHSLDVLLMEIVCCILWFYPLVYTYKKYIKQNLEYLADKGATQHLETIKNYQYALVNISHPTKQLSLINSWSHSSIKKRIIMLQKNTSNKRKLWSLSILPVVFTVVFIFFNVQTEAQTVSISDSKINEGSSEIVTISLMANTTDDGLDSIKERAKEFGIALNFSNVKRDSQNKLISYKCNYSCNDKNDIFEINGTVPVPTMYVLMQNNKNGVSSCAYKNYTNYDFEFDITNAQTGEKVDRADFEAIYGPIDSLTLGKVESIKEDYTINRNFSFK